MAKHHRSYLFEMPYQVDAPILTDQPSGIDRVLLRCRSDRPVSTITLFDTTDERLSLAGVMLAHRVVDQRGEWLLRAPDWQPWLPEEYAEPLDSGDDLPEDLAALLSGFRRRAALGPVASVVVERACYVLLDADAAELGEVRDDRVTVRRGGLAVARHRDVTFRPGDAMTTWQRSVVIERLGDAGAVKVTGFGEPIDRLTALTHPVNLPKAPADSAEISAEDYLTWLFTDRLHSLLRADLRVRKHDVPDTALLAEELVHVADTVRGLDCMVDPGWAKEFTWQVDKVTARGVRTNPSELGEAYFDALDLLASAARAPRLRPATDDEWPAEPNEPGSARQLLRSCARRQLAGALVTLDALDDHSSDQQWGAALVRIQDLVRTLEAGEPVLGKVKGRIRGVGKLLAALGATSNRHLLAHEESIAAMSPAEAYQAGRDYQSSLDHVRVPRRGFLESWPKTRAKLLDEWPEVAKPGVGELPQLSGADSSKQDSDA
ncbi:hypothetical protein [Brooklawnia sp.]|uniref:hypothetical protein n=1 Tax=Brooklawnia sp. TaxID=2699740 RepID=UPI00311D9EDD